MSAVVLEADEVGAAVAVDVDEPEFGLSAHQSRSQANIGCPDQARAGLVAIPVPVTAAAAPMAGQEIGECRIVGAPEVCGRALSPWTRTG